MNRGIIVHISSQNIDKCVQFANFLNKTLRDRGHSAVELNEPYVKENLATADNDLLARAINWAGELLLSTGALVLISVSTPVSKALAKLYPAPPAIELTIDEEFLTTAPQRLHLTAEAANLPQEIAQVVLLTETVLTDQGIRPAENHLAAGNIYSAEEEALLEEHLKALGYL